MKKYILNDSEKKDIRMTSIAERNGPLDNLKRELRYRGADWERSYWGVPDYTFPNDSNTKTSYKRFNQQINLYTQGGK